MAQLILTLVIIALLIGATFAVRWLNEEYPEDVRTTAIVLFVAASGLLLVVAAWTLADAIL